VVVQHCTPLVEVEAAVGAEELGEVLGMMTMVAMEAIRVACKWVQELVEAARELPLAIVALQVMVVILMVDVAPLKADLTEVTVMVPKPAWVATMVEAIQATGKRYSRIRFDDPPVVCRSAQVGPYGTTASISKGMDGTSYDMSGDYGRGAAAATAAGYGGVPAAGYGGAPAAGYGGAPAAGYGGAPAAGYGGAPASGAMSRGAGMEGSPQAGMAMYGNMAGYGGYMGSAPAMYQQQSQSSTGSSSPPRAAADGGYVDAYGTTGTSNGSSAASASSSNYGGGRLQSSSTTQARVDRSYRPY
jgi:hypothetical protein